MKMDYTLMGRNGELHSLKLVGFDLTAIEPYVYEVNTIYPVQTTGRMNQILAVDLSGGPTFIVGDNFDFHDITKIEHKNNKIYITFK